MLVAIRRSSEATAVSAPLERGPLRLDPERHRCAVKGEEVELTDELIRARRVAVDRYLYFHGSLFLLAAAYTLRHDGHVRVDLLYREADPRTNAVVAAGLVDVLNDPNADFTVYAPINSALPSRTSRRNLKKAASWFSPLYRLRMDSSCFLMGSYFNLNWATTDNPDGVSVVHDAFDQVSSGRCEKSF